MLCTTGSDPSAVGMGLSVTGEKFRIPLMLHESTWLYVSCAADSGTVRMAALMWFSFANSSRRVME